jgi:hypothetical protein
MTNGSTLRTVSGHFPAPERDRKNTHPFAKISLPIFGHEFQLPAECIPENPAVRPDIFGRLSDWLLELVELRPYVDPADSFIDKLSIHVGKFSLRTIPYAREIHRLSAELKASLDSAALIWQTTEPELFELVIVILVAKLVVDPCQLYRQYGHGRDVVEFHQLVNLIFMHLNQGIVPR